MFSLPLMQVIPIWAKCVMEVHTCEADAMPGIVPRSHVILGILPRSHVMLGIVPSSTTQCKTHVPA